MSLARGLSAGVGAGARAYGIYESRKKREYEESIRPSAEQVAEMRELDMEAKRTATEFKQTQNKAAKQKAFFSTMHNVGELARLDGGRAAKWLNDSDMFTNGQTIERVAWEDDGAGNQVLRAYEKGGQAPVFEADSTAWGRVQQLAGFGPKATKKSDQERAIEQLRAENPNMTYAQALTRFKSAGKKFAAGGGGGRGISGKSSEGASPSSAQLKHAKLYIDQGVPVDEALAKAGFNPPAGAGPGGTVDEQATSAQAGMDAFLKERGYDNPADQAALMKEVDAIRAGATTPAGEVPRGQPEEGVLANRPATRGALAAASGLANLSGDRTTGVRGVLSRAAENEVPPVANQPLAGFEERWRGGGAVNPETGLGGAELVDAINSGALAAPGQPWQDPGARNPETGLSGAELAEAINSGALPAPGTAWNGGLRDAQAAQELAAAPTGGGSRAVESMVDTVNKNLGTIASNPRLRDQTLANLQSMLESTSVIQEKVRLKKAIDRLRGK